MKKLLAMLLSLMMVFALVPAALADDADFTLVIQGGDVNEHLVTVDGESFLAVNVTLNGTVEDKLLTLTFDLSFDPAQVVYIDLSKDDAFNMAMVNDQNEGAIRVSMTSEGIAVTENVPVVTLFFELAEGLQTGDEIAFTLGEAVAETFTDNASVVTPHAVAASFAPFVYADTMTVPVIVKQPKKKTVMVDNDASFTVEATGGALEYLWEYSEDNGSTWLTWEGQTAATASEKAGEVNNGNLYRCTVSNPLGSVTSDSVRLTVDGVKPKIIVHPADKSTAFGTTTTFKVVAAGVGLNYQWEYSRNNGKSWTVWDGKTKTSLSVTSSDTNNGCLYRCVVTNDYGEVTSNPARLTSPDAKPLILTQPKGAKIAIGESTTFEVVAGGENLTYQWEYSKNNGSSWTVWKGKTNSTLVVKASETNNGCKYRCVVTGAGGSVTSKAVQLIVTDAKPFILTSPKNATKALGASNTFKVVAAGTGLTYQWQYSKNNGASWTNFKGKTGDTATVVASNTNNGCLYRCVVTNEYGSVTSAEARLTVSDAKPMILTQPQDATVAAGKTVTFSVVAGGADLTYQWQYSTDGTNWTNCKSGAYNTATFSFKAKASLNNRLYRCVVTNAAGSVNSKAAKLIVN